MLIQVSVIPESSVAAQRLLAVTPKKRHVAHVRASAIWPTAAMLSAPFEG